MREQLIIAIDSQRAKLAEMEQVVKEITGAVMPFFCPVVREGEPYHGHVHVFPPFAATDVSEEPIRI